MKIGLGSDHAGYKLKNHLFNFMISNFPNHEIKDFGCNSQQVSIDYPDIASQVCQQILHKNLDQAILICGSGVGISIAANRFKGIRAALCHDTLGVKLSREHNNANVLCLGDWFISERMSEELIRIWLNTDFEAGRHEKRVILLDELSA